MTGAATRRNGVDKYRHTALLWKTTGIALKLTNGALGLLAVILSLTVASKPFGATVDYPLLGYIAAVFTAVVAFFKAKERGKVFAQAARLLEDEIVFYDADRSYTISMVAAAREKGAAIIDGA